MEVRFLFLDQIKEFVELEQAHLHSLSSITVPYTVRNAHPVNEQSALPEPLDHLIKLHHYQQYSHNGFLPGCC